MSIVVVDRFSSDDNPISYVRLLLVLWMTLFAVMGHMRVANKAYAQSDSSGAKPGTKCDMYDCLVAIFFSSWPIAT